MKQQARLESAAPGAIGGRWGGGQNAAPDEARDRIVSAARACYARQSVEKTTMEHIAAEAKVGRATLYRYFPGREAVLIAVFREAVRDFLDDFGREAGEQSSFCGFFMLYLMRIARRGPSMPLHKTFFTESTALWVCRTYFTDTESLDLAVACFKDVFDRAKATGEILSDVDLTELIEISGRLLISMMLFPGTQTRSESEMRDFFERNFLRGLRP